MIEKIERYTSFKDSRGSLEGLANFGEWKEFNLVKSMANTTRGNHYHCETTEMFILLEGGIKVHTQKVVDNKLVGEIEHHFMKAGDVFLIKPFINHTFDILTAASWINVLSRPIDKEKPDIHRVPCEQNYHNETLAPKLPPQ